MFLTDAADKNALCLLCPVRPVLRYLMALQGGGANTTIGRCRGLRICSRAFAGGMYRYVVNMNRNFTNAHLLYDDKFEDARIDNAAMMANRLFERQRRRDLDGAPASVSLASGLDGDT